MDFGDDDDNTLPQDDLGLVNLEQSNLNVLSNNVEKSVKNEEGNSTSFEAEEKPRRNRCSILHKSIQGKLEISIGPEHQAELPHKIEDTIQDEGRDQCVWHPSKMPTDAKEFDDFVKTLCREAGFQPDQAMEIFLKYGSMQKALDDLNKFKERHNKTKWTEEEKMNFNALVKEQKKNFVKISKLMPTIRSPKECVEMYYKLKTKSFLINFGLNAERQTKTTQKDDWLTQLKANFPQTGPKITTMTEPVINASFLENRIKYRLDYLFGMENPLDSGGHQRRGAMQLRSTAKVEVEENNNNKE